MTADPLDAGIWSLRRATSADAAALIALQRAAYARNQKILGVVPIPLQADYHAVLREKEVWLAENDGRCIGALILEPRAGDLMIESIATDPSSQTHGLGRAMLEAAEERAQSLGHKIVRLYTGKPLTHLIAWYARHGYEIEREEALSDRTIVHMIKRLDT